MASKGVLYYTCLTHDEQIEMACRAQLAKAYNGLELGSVSRGAPIDFGDWNIAVAGKRGPLTMHRQILTGLEYIETDYVFLCESDVLYHPSHFDLTPTRDDLFYYNTNVWKVRHTDGHCVWTDDLQQVSGLCASRSLLLSFYRARIARIQSEGFDRHYEPGPKTGGYRTENWASQFPNLDIRHSATLTKSKWRPQDFRNQRYAKGWQEASAVDGWGEIERHLDDFLRDLTILRVRDATR